MKKKTGWTIHIELQQRIEVFNDVWNTNYSMFLNKMKKKKKNVCWMN